MMTDLVGGRHCREPILMIWVYPNSDLSNLEIAGHRVFPE
jgi:hypothetical protein